MLGDVCVLVVEVVASRMCLQILRVRAGLGGGVGRSPKASSRDCLPPYLVDETVLALVSYTRVQCPLQQRSRSLNYRKGKSRLQ